MVSFCCSAATSDSWSSIPSREDAAWCPLDCSLKKGKKVRSQWILEEHFSTYSQLNWRKMVPHRGPGEKCERSQWARWFESLYSVFVKKKIVNISKSTYSLSPIKAYLFQLVDLRANILLIQILNCKCLNVVAWKCKCEQWVSQRSLLRSNTSTSLPRTLILLSLSTTICKMLGMSRASVTQNKMLHKVNQMVSEKWLILQQALTCLQRSAAAWSPSGWWSAPTWFAPHWRRRYVSARRSTSRWWW